MKTFSFFLIGLLLTSMQLRAQTEDLLDNTWYLEKVIVDGEDVYMPTSNSYPVAYAEFNLEFLFTEYCNSLYADIDYHDSQEFTLSGQGLTFEGCWQLDDEYDEFDAIYYNDFFGFIEQFYQPFSYEITEESPTLLKLTITNTNNDQAIYYSETLSTQDVEGFGMVKLYPNPAKSHFSVEGDTDIKQIKIYNLTGQVVKEFQSKSIESTNDISSLSSGVYFVELSSVNGNKIVKKLVKN